MTPHPLRCWAEINLDALAFNLKRIRSLCKNAPVIAVVKADAYGHGLFAVTRRLVREKVRAFAVANLQEAAVASRAAPDRDILILGPLLPDEVEGIFRCPR